MKKNTKPQQFNIIPPDLSQKEKALELAKKKPRKTEEKKKVGFWDERS